jgi:hypothetical protein
MHMRFSMWKYFSNGCFNDNVAYKFDCGFMRMHVCFSRWKRCVNDNTTFSVTGVLMIVWHRYAFSVTDVLMITWHTHLIVDYVHAHAFLYVEKVHK